MPESCCDARARLDEIRELCVRTEGLPGGPDAGWLIPVSRISAILDRPNTAGPAEFPGGLAVQGTAKPATNSPPQVPYRRRLQGCVDAWPHAEDGAYNPACCRFPKACSPHPHPDEDPRLGPALEPMPAWGRDPDEDRR